MNVTYEYYKDSFGGSIIPENRWDTLELRISARLDQYTFNRMESGNWKNEAKAALCEMAEYMYQNADRDGIASENTDGYSVSYDTSKSMNGELYKIAEVYLMNRGLMSLAVDEDANEWNDNCL